MWKHVVVYII